MTVATASSRAIERTFSNRIQAIALSTLLVTGAAALFTGPVGAAGGTNHGPAATVAMQTAR